MIQRGSGWSSASFHQLHQCALVAGLLLAPRLVIAADDDVLDSDALAPNQKVLVNDLTFDQWTYGTDAAAAQKGIDDEINKLVRAFVKQNQLNEDQQDKLILAARVDKQRYLREIEDLRVEFDKSRSNLNELRQISTQANQIRSRRATLFGTNSFFMKARHKVLAGTTSPIKTDKWNQRHRTNIESAIRAIERSVVLDQTQKRSLTDFFWERVPVTYSDTGFEDLLVDYQIAKLPRANLKLHFVDDQWPRVQPVLEAFLDYDKILKDKGLIDPAGKVIYASNPNPVVPLPEPIVAEIKPLSGNVAKGFNKGFKGGLVAREFEVQPPPVVDRAWLAKPTSMPARHRANAESAVRALSRKVRLREGAQIALVGLLLDEVPAPAQFGAFDDLLLQYHLSQMSEEKWQPLFDAKAWPEIKAGLKDLSEVAGVLKQEGLLPKPRVTSIKPEDKQQNPDHQGKDF